MSSNTNYEQLRQSSSQDLRNMNDNNSSSSASHNNNSNNNTNQNDIASTSATVPEDPKLKRELDEYIEKQRELLSSPMDDLTQEEYNNVLKEYRTLLDLYRRKQISPDQKKTLNERHQTLVKYQYQHLNPEQQEQYLAQQREQAKARKIKGLQRKKKEMYDNLRYYAKEISSIIRPVILCICLSILWVKLTLKVDTSLITSTDINIISGGNNSSGGTEEDSSDGFDYKGLLNSFLNAGIIIGNIVIATFVILLLFKFNCSKVLYGLFILTVVMLIGIFGYNLLSTLIFTYNIPMDWITVTLFMYNLSVVGVIVIFWKGPAKVQQGYLILMSSLMAFSLTGLADWTTWILLALLACWDLIAVLCPFGPLKMLVEHSDNNKQMIPQALIYSTMIWMMAQDVRIKIDNDDDSDGENTPNGEKYELHELEHVPSAQFDECEASSQGSTQELIGSKQRRLNKMNNEDDKDYKININDDEASDISNNTDQVNKIRGKEAVEEEEYPSRRSSAHHSNDEDEDDEEEERERRKGKEEEEEEENKGNQPRHPRRTEASKNRRHSNERHRSDSDETNDREEGREEEGDDDDDEEEGLKLGLGDFVFYSVLIARAAMHDWITTFACAIAVLFGLTLTIFLLSIYQKALPALPISIVFGIIFYIFSSSMLGPLMEYLTRIPTAVNNMKGYSDLSLNYDNGLSFVYL